jgi:beta-lactamase superfamily II metal-dependent hydrolase
MRIRVVCLLFLAAAIAAVETMVGAQGQKPLEISAIDVEGGQAILFVSPTGESMLVDAGNPGARDADRIAAAAREAGAKQIDYLVVTHFHGDHFGGVPDLAMRLPIRNFVDYGAPVETTEQALAAARAYAAVRDQGRHLPVKPGDTIPINGLDVRVVAAGGASITRPLPGGGAPNPLCADLKPQAGNAAAAEDGRSVGIVVGLGRFRALNLGDTTWNKEYDLVCPNNLLGTVDLYFTNAHGIVGRISPTLVHAIRPRIALFDNGPMKGVSREPFLTIKSSPGLEDIWQLHYSLPRPARVSFGETGDQGGKDLNASEEFIANLEEQHDTAHALKISARPDGSFVVTNQRTGYRKEYKPRQ